MMSEEDKAERIDDTRRSLNDGLTLCRKIVDHYRSTLEHYAEDRDRPNSIFGRMPDAEHGLDDIDGHRDEGDPSGRDGAGLQ